MELSTVVSPIPTTRVHFIHPKDKIIRDPKSVVQTRGMAKKSSGEHAMISYIQKQRRSNHKDFQNCLFSCFFSQQEPIKIAQGLDDESWVESMQEELLQFKIQKVWSFVDLPYGKKAIGTKWVYRNKKDERGIVVKNKARLVAQGYKQEEGIDYDEIFAHVARIEAIRLFLAYTSFMNFLVYQIDVKSTFLYGTIEEEVYTKLLELDDIIFGSTKKSLCIDFEQIMHKRFQMSSMGELTFFLGLQVKQKEDEIFISQDKYVGEILKKFSFSSIRTANTLMETNKALTKDEDGEDVDVHLYRSMIGSLMYLTSSRPDIMFFVCACSRFQVQPKVSYLNAVKMIFRYLKGRPNLCLWYPKDSPFILEAFSDSYYAGASLDRKSTIGGEVNGVQLSQAPRHHGGAPAQTRSERVLEKPNEPPLSKGNTSGSGEGMMEHQFELTANVPIIPHDSPLLGGYTLRSDEGYFLNSKAFRVLNSGTRIVEENLHIRFSESTPNTIGSGPDWLFDIDALTRTINYEPIVAGTQSKGFTGTKASDNAGQARKETKLVKDYILLPLWTADPPFSENPKSSHDDGCKPSSDDGNKVDEDPRKDSESNDQEKEDNVNNTNNVNFVSSIVNDAGTNEVNAVGAKTSIELPVDLNMPALEDYSIFNFSRDDEDDGAEADMNNLDTTIQASPNPTTRIHKDRPLDQLQEVWTLVDLPNGKRVIDSKWVFKNKKDEKGIVIRNKERLVAQGYTQDEGIDYDEVFALVARIKAIRLFLAYASFKDFVVYQMDVKSAFLYGKIEEEVYVCQPPGFEDPDFPDRVYKKELCIAFKKLMHEKFQMSFMGELTFFLGLQVKQKKDGIFICQDKYMEEILKKFGFIEVKTASTPMETQKPLLKDEDGEEVDVHMYRSMIGSLMYLTSSKPDIMYLKGQPKLGLWYPKDSPFDLVSYEDSDYAGASLDRKYTTGGCQFLGCRLIS
ncbi:retrovirus-related pol polyprotein from transposon TNT 1-94 [Tanacetum coccineum]|uniref:Retrovirus-related pol polyprotein from transposon TNT 1-94 n=1 Tax=Tanacetum coccineum TaxID=301880 RepID=A0ABQ5F1E4_9ASTR